MERYKTRRVYFKMKEKKSIRYGLIGFLLIMISFLVLFCLFFPNKSGIVGYLTAKKLRFILGAGNYVLPMLIFWIGVRFIKEGKVETPLRLGISQIVVLWVITTFLSLVTQDLPTKNLGGFVGKYSEVFLEKALGVLGAYLILVIILLAVINFSLKYPPLYLLKLMKKRLFKEWEEWQELRKQSKVIKDKAPIIKVQKQQDNEESEKSTVNEMKKDFIKNINSLKKKVKERFAKSKEEIAMPKQVKAAGRALTESKKVDKFNENQEEQVEQKFTLPDVGMLSKIKEKPIIKKEEELVSSAALLEQSLASFNIQAKVTDINPGPVITRYDMQPGIGVKVGSIISLADDIALCMKAKSIRVMAPVPGKAAVGIEIPNQKSELVTLSEVISSKTYQDSNSLLTMGLGKTTEGSVYVTDLIPMPHLLVAGATGSGKSVCIHSIIISILYKALPSQVKLLLIDPKRLELPVYNGLPHLFDPKTSSEEVEVITNPREAEKSLEKLVKIMEMRYEKFAKAAVRNIDGYNVYAEKNNMPKEYYIVVIIDELADLMMVAPKEIEDSIQRLAQMARAVGIHLILATQRPSVDVLTGVIKANLPSRIAFQVLSKVDSRVILDVGGADELIGKGDMLFIPSGEPKPIRLQGAFVSENEIENIVNFYKAQGNPYYNERDYIIQKRVSKFEDEKSSVELLKALQLIKERRRVSQDLLKAHFGSSARATNVLSLLEVKGFIKKPEGSNRWEILFERLEEYLQQAQEAVPGDAGPHNT
ncbi:MAG: DNA translocase FtsK 4TM domain-containing protein [bacterium]